VNQDQSSLSRSVYWYLTFRCNLACRHCTLEAGPGSGAESELSRLQVDRILDNILDYGPASMLISGGEPLVSEHCLYVLERFQEAGIPWSMETNGVLFDEPFLRVAVNAQSRGVLRGLYLSLDGATARTHDWLRGRGSYAATIRGAEECLRRGIVPKFQCVLNPRNTPEIGRYLDLMRRLGTDHVKFVFTNPVGRGERLYDELGLTPAMREQAIAALIEAAAGFDRELVFKVPPAFIPPHLLLPLRQSRVVISMGCPFPLLGILPDGSVAFCAIAREGARLGNALDRPLREMHDDPLRREVRRSYLGAELEGICGECLFRGSCRGYCRVWAEMKQGSLTGPFPLCQEMDRAGDFPACYKRPRLSGTLEDAVHELAP